MSITSYHRSDRYLSLTSNTAIERRSETLDEGKKDHPCAIVVAVPQGDKGQVRTIVAPITLPSVVPTQALRLKFQLTFAKA